MQIGELTGAVEAVGKAAHAVRQAVAADVAQHVPTDELLSACAELARERGAVEAAYLAVVAEVEQRRRSGRLAGTAAFGESSTEGFLRTCSPITPGQARSDVAAAGCVSPRGDLAPMAEQLAEGAVTRAHVDVAVRCLDSIPGHLRSTPEQRATICGFITGLAPNGHFRDLRRATDALLDRLAPEVRDRFDPVALERRYLDLATDSTGMVVGRFALDPEAGATLSAAIAAASAPAPAKPGTDGTDGTDGTGQAATGSGAIASAAGVPVDASGRDTRTARQRRADALTTLAQTALGAQVPRRGERPRVVVHTTAAELARATTSGDGAARTEAGQTLGAEAARRLACDAVLQRVVWDEDGTTLAAVPLELGRENRLASPQQRRALAARDRGCIVPGCGAQPSWCDAHHIVHWADGGATDLCNMALLCGAHHSAVHAGLWLVRMGADGIPEVVPPARVDPLRRPRRAPHHQVDAAVAGLDAVVGDVTARDTAPPEWRPPGVDADDPPF